MTDSPASPQLNLWAGWRKIIIYLGNRFKGFTKRGETMSHSLTKIWIHVVFGTKMRRPLIQCGFEKKLYAYIRDHLEIDFQCRVRAIGGAADHLHILFELNPNYAVKDILKNIKGESSYWINAGNSARLKFAWQIGYGPFSVSESSVQRVQRYIGNQAKQHKRRAFIEEYEQFIKLHGLSILPQNAEAVEPLE